jgi:NADPH:quinone reductase-like Zn-dependent oxidoreductase
MRMRAIGRPPDGPADLVSEAPSRASARHAQVAVKAAGCNFFDILMCRGSYQVKPPFPFVPGAEVAGVVTAVAEGVTGFAAGDRVFGSSGLGGFAERALVPAGGACAARCMSFEEGAFPIIYPTGYGARHRGLQARRRCSCTPRPAAWASLRCRSARRSARA